MVLNVPKRCEPCIHRERRYCNKFLARCVKVEFKCQRLGGKTKEDLLEEKLRQQKMWEAVRKVYDSKKVKK